MNRPQHMDHPLWIATLQNAPLSFGQWVYGTFAFKTIACLGLILFLTPAYCTLAEETDSLATVQALETVRALENIIGDIIERNRPSVVAVARVRRPQVSGPLFQETIAPELNGFQYDPKDPEFVPHDFGTGVVVGANGLILTNYHVLGRDDEQVKASNFFVTVATGKVYDAQIFAADPWSDLAVLKIAATDLKPIEFGDATQVRQGSFVVALGNPYAVARDGRPSASWGILSNRSRKLGLSAHSSPAGGRETMHHFGTLLQTDAKLNWGASGGALLNLRGKMIGLTISLAAAIAFESAAGYAIPVDKTFQRIVDELRKGKEVEYGFLGVSPENLRSESALGDSPTGVRLRQVLPGTPADLAGLFTGDIVTHIDGEVVANTDQFMLFIGRHPVGTRIPLQIQRGGVEILLEVTLAKKQVLGARSTIANKDNRWWRGLHFDHATSSESFRELSVIDSSQYVVVTDVLKDTPAWRSGVRRGMFISHAAEQRVETPAAFLAAVANHLGPVELRFAEHETNDHTIRIIEPVKTNEN